MDRMQTIEQGWLKANIPDFRVGDTVDVHLRIVEEASESGQDVKKKAGKKKEEKRERIQIYSGVVIADKHDGIRRTFTVRRIVAGEGVERIFPVHSPVIAKIAVKKSGIVRRAKLYYLRNLAGRAARLVEKKSVRQFGDLVAPAQPVSAPPPAAPAASEPAASEPAGKSKVSVS